MGKKKIVTKTSDVVSLQDAAGSASVKPQGQKTKQRIERGRIYIQVSYNNTLMTATDSQGNVIDWVSAGSLGFGGPKKATAFAATKTAEALAEKLRQSGPFEVDVFIKGIGGGRDASLKALVNCGLFEISSIKDITPIPHNGPRAPKVRRV